MATAGEKPGKGKYKCQSCGEIVILNDDNDVLPPCPNCEHTEFTKLED